MKKIISILSCSLIFSFTSLYAEVDGFKDLKFGMNTDEVSKIMKRECNKVGDFQYKYIGGKECYTLMGEKRKLSAFFEGNELVEIRLLEFEEILHSTMENLAKGLKKKYKLYNETFENSTNFLYLAFEGGQIAYTANPDYGATLRYMEKKRAKEFLTENGLLKSDDSDF